MMPRCSGLSAELEVDRPSKAANGLETGLGACGAWACGAWARAPSAASGIADLGIADLGAAIAPVVVGWVLIVGRGVGSGTLWASAGAAVRQINKDANNAAIASLWPVCASRYRAITVSELCWCMVYSENRYPLFGTMRSRPALSSIPLWAGCGYFAAPIMLICLRMIWSENRCPLFGIMR